MLKFEKKKVRRQKVNLYEYSLLYAFKSKVRHFGNSSEDALWRKISKKIGLMSYGVTLKCNNCLNLRYSINFMVIFYGAANNSDYVASIVSMTLIDEIETAWKEAVVA